ncbi:MAG: hypothetical protein ACRDXB_22825 [Actinomycetes bacterium]
MVADERRRLDDFISIVRFRIGAHTHRTPVSFGKCTTALTVGNAFTPITPNAEDTDSHNARSTSSNTSRYTAQIAGYYILSRGHQQGTRGLMPLGTGLRALHAHRGANLIDGDAAWRLPSPTRLVSLVVDDYVELQNCQDTGSNKTLDVIAGVSAIFDVAYVRPT